VLAAGAGGRDLHRLAPVAASAALLVVIDPTVAEDIGFQLSLAAVLGIVTTMSQLSGDTSRIGEHIAGALVGTFLGILLCYGFAGPLASAMENRAQEDGKAFECVKVALMANLRGYNPMVSVEFARKSLVAQVRPSFMELEGHLKGARAGAGA